MQTKTLIQIILNTAFGIVLAMIIFKTFKNFLKGIYYLCLPNIVSIVKKDWDNDFNYTHKMLLWIVLMISIIIIEFVLLK